MKSVLRIGQSLPAIAVGQWQLHWYGQVASSPQAAVTPFIYAFFHRVERLASGELRHYREGRRVLLPVTDTPAFPLGTVLNDGYITDVQKLSPHFTWSDITIDFSRECLQVFSRLGVEDSEACPLLDEPFRLGPCRHTAASDRRYNSLLLKVEGCNGSLPYVFPCMTIFQFFWGPTSKWAQLMLDGRFSDPEHYLFNQAKSRLSADGRSAMLWLRQWMKDEDVPFLASIAFDSYAMERGADIYRYLAQGSRARGPHFIRAIPPFEGQMPLRVLRRKVKTDESEFWLVQLIRSCGYRPTIQEISFDRDNDGRSPEDVLAGIDSEKLPIERQQLFPSLSTSVLELSHMPHRSSSGESDIDVGQVHTRFPNLDEIPCKKLPQTDTTYQSADQATARLAMWEREVSTLGDSRSARELAPGANLRAQQHKETLESEQGRQTLGDVSLVASSLLGATGDTIEIEGTNHLVKIESVFPGEPVGDYFLVPLEPYPHRSPAWRFIDKEKTKRKRGLCLRMTFESIDNNEKSVRYLLDFEPRMGTQNSMLLLWSSDGLQLRDEFQALSQIVRCVSLKESTVLSTDELNGLCSRTRKHTSSDASLLLAEIYLAAN